MILRFSKTAILSGIAAWISLVAFGNLTDYGTNFLFVQHVMRMDSVFPDSALLYRAMPSPIIHHVAYGLIIAAESASALLCWAGAWRMARAIRADGPAFRSAKIPAIAGLTLGMLIWQFGFMAVAGEWFGAWMSAQWNPAGSAFRFAMLILGALIYIAQPDE